MVVYTALDTEFSEPILDDFSKQSHVQALAKFDTESTKTVGPGRSDHRRSDAAAVRRVLEQRDPEHAAARASWACSSPIAPPRAGEYPAMDRSPKGTWHGFAARARVSDRQHRSGDRGGPATFDRRPGRSEVERPRRRSPNRCSAPRPRTPPACSQVWGDEQAKEFFTELKDNAVQIDGRQQAGGAGRVRPANWPFGLTDTDDAIGELEKGMRRGDRLSRSRRQRTGHAVHSQHAGDHQGLPAPGRSRDNWSTTC